MRDPVHGATTITRMLLSNAITSPNFQEVDKFNASSIVDGLAIDYSHVNISDLEANKDALTGTFDFDSVKNTIANTC